MLFYILIEVSTILKCFSNQWVAFYVELPHLACLSFEHPLIYWQLQLHSVEKLLFVRDTPSLVPCKYPVLRVIYIFRWMAAAKSALDGSLRLRTTIFTWSSSKENLFLFYSSSYWVCKILWTSTISYLSSLREKCKWFTFTFLCTQDVESNVRLCEPSPVDIFCGSWKIYSGWMSFITS